MHDWYAPSGRYAVRVGRTSDNILLQTELEFSTRKLLPLHVTMASTIGELLEDPRTGPAMQQLMASMSSGMASRIDLSDPSMQEMAEATKTAVPLKSLISFGMMTMEQANGLITMLNEIIEDKQIRK